MAGLSILPGEMRNTIEEAVSGIIVSGFSTTVVIGAVIAIVSSALICLFFQGGFRPRLFSTR